MINKKNMNLSLDSEYQFYLKDEKIRLIRILSLLGIALYGAFLFVDYWALSSAFYTVVLIRGFVLGVLGMGYLLTYHSNFIKFYDLTVTTMFVVALGGVEAMIYLASPIDHAYSTYVSGVIIILIALFSWTHLRVAITSILAISSVALYIYIEVSVRGTLINGGLPTLITNTFFLVSSIIFGFFAQVLRDGYLRHNFSLQQSLKEALEDKTAEANDYEYQANHDALTLLPNRRYITELLNESLQIAKEKDKILAILFFDLNGFKQVNDIFGHAVGDEILIIVAKRLELAIRKGDHIARLGGDEYLVGLMIDRDHASEVNTMAAKFTAIISEPMNIDGNIVKVGASVGIAAYPVHGNNVNVLIDIADKKMYRIKKGLQKLARERDQNDEPEAVIIFPGNSKNRS